MRRTLALAFLGAALAAACQPGSDRDSRHGSTVTVAYCCGEEALNPIHDMEAKKLVFLTLLTEDEQGNLAGRLATSWEPSADFREWTYRLRTDVTWHDGVPFTARDVEFTIDLMREFWDADYGSGAFESVSVHDDSTVTIRSGHARRLYQVHMVFYPRHLLENMDPETIGEWSFWARPVGNGPYRFVNSVPETMMEFEGNPDFYAGPPAIDRVVLRFGAEGSVADILGGRVDVSSEVPLRDASSLVSDPRFQLFHNPWGVVHQAIYWNSANPLFRDPIVRRALTMAIDRRELHRALDIPDLVPIVGGPITPDQWNRRDLPSPMPFAPDSARALLAAAGWSDSDGDGILDRAGRRFQFTTLARTVSSENAPGNVTAGVFVQSQLRKVGVQAHLQPLDPGVIHSRVEAGEFEAAISWFRSYEIPWLGRLGLGAGGSLGYRSPALLELMEAASNTWIPAEEDSLYVQIARILREDCPVTFLYPHVGLTVAHRRVRGLREPWRVDPVANMDELWIEE